MDHSSKQPSPVDRGAASHRNSGWKHGEKGLNSCAGGTRISMGEKQTLSIERQGTFSVHCSSGTLWVTKPGCSTDVVLGEGEELDLPTREKLVIVAVGRSQICIPPGFAVRDAARGTSPRIVKRGAR